MHNINIYTKIFKNIHDKKNMHSKVSKKRYLFSEYLTETTIVKN